MFSLNAETDRDTPRWGAVAAFSVGLCLATGALVWFGFVSTEEWSRGAELLQNNRQAEALTLVRAALNRDMKGVWTTVIVPMTPRAIEEDPPYDLVQLTASAFDRFPYPESFIIWKSNGQDEG